MYIYIYNGILLRHEIMDFCHSQQHEGHYAKWNKSEKDKC